MNHRPIGLNHGEHCDSDDPDRWCDWCRETAARDWATDEESDR